MALRLIAHVLDLKPVLLSRKEENGYILRNLGSQALGCHNLSLSILPTTLRSRYNYSHCPYLTRSKALCIFGPVARPPFRAGCPYCQWPPPPQLHWAFWPGFSAVSLQDSPWPEPRKHASFFTFKPQTTFSKLLFWVILGVTKSLLVLSLTQQEGNSRIMVTDKLLFIESFFPIKLQSLLGQVSQVFTLWPKQFTCVFFSKPWRRFTEGLNLQEYRVILQVTDCLKPKILSRKTAVLRKQNKTKQ